MVLLKSLMRFAGRPYAALSQIYDLGKWLPMYQILPIFDGLIVLFNLLEDFSSFD